VSSKAFVARLAGCPVFDPQGDKVGRVRDVVMVPRQAASPRIVGFVVEVTGKRRVFLSIGRVMSIGGGQLITTGLINLRRFEQRGGEQLVLAEVLGRGVTLRDGVEARLEDLSIVESPGGEWTVDQVFLRKPRTSPFGKGPTTLAGWMDVRHDDEGEQESDHILAQLQDLPAADAATALLDLPSQRMLEVAGDLPNDRLADVLEEMSEDDQVSILDALGDDRAAEVLDQMQPDDAADLIAQLPFERGEALLDLMEPEEAEDVRMLLAYGQDTAGGLMTTEPVILASDATVAEALATIRRHEIAPALAAAVFVTLPPYARARPGARARARRRDRRGAHAHHGDVQPRLRAGRGCDVAARGRRDRRRRARPHPAGRLAQPRRRGAPWLIAGTSGRTASPRPRDPVAGCGAAAASRRTASAASARRSRAAWARRGSSSA
jgi:flagellar motility protein MotE (MotC chaperone)/sporulation protein YlmC with PRC-barrel domain